MFKELFGVLGAGRGRKSVKLRLYIAHKAKVVSLPALFGKLDNPVRVEPSAQYLFC